MNLDNLSIYALVEELSYLNEGARIEKIHQPTQYEALFHLRTKEGNKKMLVSIHPETFRLHMTTRTFENPLQPKSFCVVLRKYIEGGVITKIKQLYKDRIIRLTIRVYNAVGDLVEYFLYVELMGKYSNLILVDQEGIIVDALKKVDITKSEYREVLPRLKYYLPKMGEPKTGFAYYLQPFLKNWLEQQNFQPEMLLLHAKEAKGYYYRLQNEKILYSFIDVSTSLADIKEQFVFASFSEAIDLAYYERTISQQLKEKTSNLLTFVNQFEKRNIRKLAKLKQELVDAEDNETYQIIGNLLLAQQYKVGLHQEEVVLDNFYVADNSTITVKLDPWKNAAQNAQLYFKRYNKGKTAIAKLQEQILKTEEELAYFETISQSLEYSDLKQADEIREELVAEGYYRDRSKKVAKKTKPNFSHYVYQDVDYYVGKNNLQNDYVTFKMRRKDYTWLHVKDFPGSHVLIAKKAPISEEELHVGALLAAHFSKMRTSENVAVDYTLVQHVTKPSGAKPGFVIYREQKTIFVTPSLTNLQKYFDTI